MVSDVLTGCSSLPTSSLLLTGQLISDVPYSTLAWNPLSMDHPQAPFTNLHHGISRDNSAVTNKAGSGKCRSFLCPAADLSLGMSDTKIFYAASLCVAASLAILLRWRQRGASRPPYPPGPRGYPLVGSVLGVPRNVPIWKGFTSVAEKFSRCFTSASGGHPAKGATVLRHRCTIPEDILGRLHRS